MISRAARSAPSVYRATSHVFRTPRAAYGVGRRMGHLRGRAEKINELVDLESPKVVTMEELKVGEKKVYCRCWKSGCVLIGRTTFPLCDGTHAKWNKQSGDNVGPLIVSGPKE
eukprot:1394565-Amorphochlora_amoeboformis.AAC.1